jgi:diguanylate cyclase (GGDEF)-like protein
MADVRHEGHTGVAVGVRLGGSSITVLPERTGRSRGSRRPAEGAQPSPQPPSRLWAFVPLLTAVMAAASTFSAPRRAQWLVVGGGAAAVIAVAWPAFGSARARSRRFRHPLGLISVGLWLTVLGEVLHAAGAAYPSYADAIELAAYPVMILGLLRLVRARLRERPLDTLLMAAIAPTALGAFAWMPMVTAVTHWVPGAHRAAWLTVAFLGVDMLAVAMLARLTIMFRGRPLAYQLLLGAFGAMLGAHASRAAASITNVVPAPFGSQTLLLVAFGLLAAAALHPTLLPAITGMRPKPAPIGRGHVLLLAAAVVVGPLAIGVQYVHAGDWVIVAVGAPALISLLVVAHLGRLVRERGELEHVSSHDILTELPNRARFNEELVRALTRDAQPQFAVGFVDLDRFKKVNDSLGHDAGDDLLRQVAQRLQEHVREGDMVARLAGDEFGLLVRDIADEETATAVARHVLDGFGTHFTVAGHRLFMTPSIGLALAPKHGEDAETLLKNADRAMYEAKSRGRNTTEVYSPRLEADSHQQLAIETRLHTGIADGELVVHYQPKLSLRTGRVTGVEALVRWQHPTIGLVPPGAFMQLAEETGLVASIGEQVLHTACKQVQQWRQEAYPDLTVSVNLSIRQFQLQDVSSIVAAALSGSGLPPHALELELTESAELASADDVGRVLERLRELGVRCSIDDFGTGYTGIAYLNDLPIDKIKLDKSFIDSIKPGSDDAPFVRAMIAMAHSLGLEVVAEGVETVQQAGFLREQGCDTMQGYLFSRPLPADDLESLLASVQSDDDDRDAAGLVMPGAQPTSAFYGRATDPHALGDLLWNESHAAPALRFVEATADGEEAPATLVRRTLVLSSAAGVMTVPLFLGLGSAGALPPHVQHAVSSAFDQLGVTPAHPLRPDHHVEATAHPGTDVAAGVVIPAQAGSSVHPRHDWPHPSVPVTARPGRSGHAPKPPAAGKPASGHPTHPVAPVGTTSAGSASTGTGTAAGTGVGAGTGTGTGTGTGKGTGAGTGTGTGASKGTPPGQAGGKPGQATAPGQGAAKPGRGTTKPGKGATKPGKGTTKPGKGTAPGQAAPTPSPVPVPTTGGAATPTPTPTPTPTASPTPTPSPAPAPVPGNGNGNGTANGNANGVANGNGNAGAQTTGTTGQGPASTPAATGTTGQGNATSTPAATGGQGGAAAGTSTGPGNGTGNGSGNPPVTPPITPPVGGNAVGKP